MKFHQIHDVTVILLNSSSIKTCTFLCNILKCVKFIECFLFNKLKPLFAKFYDRSFFDIIIMLSCHFLVYYWSWLETVFFLESIFDISVWKSSTIFSCMCIYPKCTNFIIWNHCLMESKLACEVFSRIISNYNHNQFVFLWIFNG